MNFKMQYYFKFHYFSWHHKKIKLKKNNFLVQSDIRKVT